MKIIITTCKWGIVLVCCPSHKYSKIWSMLHLCYSYPFAIFKLDLFVNNIKDLIFYVFGSFRLHFFSWILTFDFIFLNLKFLKFNWWLIQPSIRRNCNLWKAIYTWLKLGLMIKFMVSFGLAFLVRRLLKPTVCPTLLQLAN
jgi:hypothetical protein